MTSVVGFELAQVRPPELELLQAQGIPGDSALSERVRATLDTAYALFHELAAPVGLFEELPREEFPAIYAGEGRNAPDSPLSHIVPRAEALALYAATVGERVNLRIGELFHERDVALGYLLDAVASAAADRLSDLLAESFGARLAERGLPAGRARVLPYSPGYCGWHVSGQRSLFTRLRPEQIGIRLSDSCLMTPLKSVSGVLVAGPGEAHRFRPEFPFCEACVTHECGRRMASVLRH